MPAAPTVGSYHCESKRPEAPHGRWRPGRRSLRLWSRRRRRAPRRTARCRDRMHQPGRSRDVLSRVPVLAQQASKSRRQLGVVGQQRQHIGDPHACSPDDRPSVDDVRVDRDAVQQGHGRRLQSGGLVPQREATAPRGHAHQRNPEEGAATEKRSGAGRRGRGRPRRAGAENGSGRAPGTPARSAGPPRTRRCRPSARR